MCEVQSQGLEMLVNQYAGDMFGEGAEAFEFETVTDMLYVIIICRMLQEFEEAVYMDPDMSLEDMNRTFKEIQDSYHGWYFLMSTTRACAMTGWMCRICFLQPPVLYGIWNLGSVALISGPCPGEGLGRRCGYVYGTFE